MTPISIKVIHLHLLCSWGLAVLATGTGDYHSQRKDEDMRKVLPSLHASAANEIRMVNGGKFAVPLGLNVSAFGQLPTKPKTIEKKKKQKNSLFHKFVNTEMVLAYPYEGPGCHEHLELLRKQLAEDRAKVDKINKKTEQIVRKLMEEHGIPQANSTSSTVNTTTSRDLPTTENPSRVMQALMRI
ncbi:unnamed protein product [Notodromas monacha]|uniref:Uncharacterized protein n=1 Tax=Notodromas monacha TaxID=399045 RepID=A0A7R9BSD1_9CRUS|nr:unnamed protein product [Notodromas monacha]CAG0919902.1 unnamed protein product [Notodromas monacha]